MMMKTLKSLYFLTGFTILTAYHVGAICLYKLYCVLTNTPLRTQTAHAIAIKWGQRIFKLIPSWTMDLKGRENLPKENEPCVIIANHESTVDIFSIYFLGIQFRWLAKDAAFRIPFIGQGMKITGYIPVTRGDKESHRKALKMSKQVLENKISMFFFPEGTRSVSGRPETFKVGAFKLAAENNVPILPVVLHGAGNLLYKRSICPNKACLKMTILPKTWILPGESVEDFTLRVQKLVQNTHSNMSGRN